MKHFSIFNFVSAFGAIALCAIFLLITTLTLAQIPTDGLVAYYPFNGNANDESGNGNNGTLVGATITSDRFGVPNKACLINGNSGFDGSGIFVSIPNSVQGMSQVTLSIWVKEYNLTYYHGEAYISFGAHGSGLLSIGHFNSANPSGNISFDVSNPPNGLGIGYPYDESFTNTYKHYILVYDGVAGTMKAYQNGNLIEIQAGMTGAIVTPIDFGGIGKHLWVNSGSGSSTRFNGEVDDVRIYNRALSYAEIQALYHEGDWNASLGITLTSPNGGEIWYKGTPYNIQWSSVKYTGNVQILLQKGSTPPQNISGSVSNSGSYPFTPPCNLESNSDYKIIVAGVPSGNPHDQSDANFTITNSPSGDPCAGEFKLRFPLDGHTAFNHRVISVFDHFMADPYCQPDNKIIDCWADSGILRYSAEPISYRSCTLYGYRKKDGEQPRKFGGFLLGSPDTVLFYDNHAGYDYRASLQQVFATQRGRIIYPISTSTFTDGRKVHAIGIQHLDNNDQPNGYISYFLHMYTYKDFDSPYSEDPPTPANGTIVRAGDYIGRSGKEGTNDPHLHYELWYNNQVVDPYRWAGTQPDPYAFPNSSSGNLNLWETHPNPYSVSASLLAGGTQSRQLGVSTVTALGSVLVNWIFDACADSLDHFELTRIKNDGSNNTFIVPAVGCPFFSYLDSQIDPNETYSYFVKAVFSDFSSSGTSPLSSIYSSPTSERTQTLYSQNITTVPFEILVGGLYQITLSQPSQQALRLRTKARFLSSVDSVGFFLNWELRDSSGNIIDKSNPSVGNILYTDSSQSFMVAFSNNRTGIWNLTLLGIENIPLGDSLVVTTKIDTTTSAVYTVNNDVLYIGGIPIFTSTKDSVTVTNIGNYPLDINWQYNGVSQFAVEDGSSTIPPSGFVYIPIIFNPSNLNEVTGKIVLTHNGITSPDTVQIIGNGGPEMLKKYYLEGQWNILSLPMIFEDTRKSIIYPTSSSDAFAYEGTYQSQDTLDEGKGYWLKYAAPESLSLIGVPLHAESIAVKDGWNLIGSISDPIPASSITSEPPGVVTSSFFGYTSTYTTSDTIYPGKGYWVKVNQDGQLILSSTIQLLSKASIKIVPTSEMPPSPPWESTGRVQLPKEYRLEQNYPNPFNPITTIKYGLSFSSNVKLRIFNVLGQVVATLKDEEESAGYKQIEWNSSAVASGIYFYRLEATSISDPGKSFTQVRKMILIK